LRRLLRDTLRGSWFQRGIGFLAAEYLKFVWRTNRFTLDPPGLYERVEPQLPAIFAFWHGQHFMTPFIKTKDSHVAKVLVSLHPDGEYNAIAAERLGIGTIRGSGDHGSGFHRKGGISAYREMVRALEENYNIALTADVPKRSRVVGLGIIMLARESGRPIMPFAMATSRYIQLDNWDRTTINLPFGRGARKCAPSPRRSAQCSDATRLRARRRPQRRSLRWPTPCRLHCAPINSAPRSARRSRRNC